VWKGIWSWVRVWSKEDREWRSQIQSNCRRTVIFCDIVSLPLVVSLFRAFRHSATSLGLQAFALTTLSAAWLSNMINICLLSLPSCSRHIYRAHSRLEDGRRWDQSFKVPDRKTIDSIEYHTIELLPHQRKHCPNPPVLGLWLRRRLRNHISVACNLMRAVFHTFLKVFIDFLVPFRVSNLNADFAASFFTKAA
jgi:hypothetical protein